MVLNNKQTKQGNIWYWIFSILPRKVIHVKLLILANKRREKKESRKTTLEMPLANKNYDLPTTFSNLGPKKNHTKYNCFSLRNQDSEQNGYNRW